MGNERVISLCEAIREAYVEEMRRDERVFMLGTCIQTPTFPHTKDLCAEFGAARILDTPIAEAATAGAAMGAAQEGLRPIADFMYAGFAYYAASEIFLQAFSIPLPTWKPTGVANRVRWHMWRRPASR